MSFTDDLVNSIDEAILLCDLQTKVIYINRSAEELCLRSSRDMIGKKLSSIMRDEKTLLSLIRKTIAETRSVRGKSLNIHIGREVSVDFSIAPFYRDGKVDGAVLLLSENRDISDRGDYVFDSMVYVIGSIAHEIKNPLAGIKGAAQLLCNNTQGEDISDYTNLIVRETDRLNSILGDYLTIGRKPAFQQVNLHEVLEQAVLIMAPLLQKRGITLKRMYDPSLPDVMGDEGKLLQVFLNIIKNAAEAMRKNGVIEIATFPSKEAFRDKGRTKRWAVISITDTGRGIAEDDLEKIFLPFYTKKKGGTGIGLALTKKIIKDHHGFITVKSRINKGTAFLIYVPFEKHG